MINTNNNRYLTVLAPQSVNAYYFVVIRIFQVQRTMLTIKTEATSVNHCPEAVQPTTKKAAQKLTNFRVSCTSPPPRPNALPCARFSLISHYWWVVVAIGGRTHEARDLCRRKLEVRHKIPRIRAAVHREID